MADALYEVHGGNGQSVTILSTGRMTTKRRADADQTARWLSDHWVHQIDGPFTVHEAQEDDKP